MRTLHLPIAEPCHEDWNAMHPVAGGRHCDRCEKQVYDLSAMTEAEARALLASRAGERICVRYRYEDDRVRFRPSPTAAAGRGAALAMALAACTPHEHPDHRPEVSEAAAPCMPEAPVQAPQQLEPLGQVPTVEPPTITAPPPRPVRADPVKMGRLPKRPPNPQKVKMGKPILEFKGEAIAPDEF